MTPINPEGVIQTAQVILAVLGHEKGFTPNNLVEGVVSGKSLMRGLISGQLVLCTTANDVKPPGKQTPKPKAKPKAKPKGKSDAAPPDIE